MSGSDLRIDLGELERDREQNERERREFLEYYAEWLRSRGIVRHDAPARGGRKRSKRVTKTSRRKREASGRRKAK